MEQQAGFQNKKFVTAFLKAIEGKEDRIVAAQAGVSKQTINEAKSELAVVFISVRDLEKLIKWMGVCPTHFWVAMDEDPDAEKRIRIAAGIMASIANGLDPTELTTRWLDAAVEASFLAASELLKKSKQQP